MKQDIIKTIIAGKLLTQAKAPFCSGGWPSCIGKAK
jgi:hypothetical protein